MIYTQLLVRLEWGNACCIDEMPRMSLTYRLFWKQVG